MTIIEQIKAEIERLKKAQEVSEDKDYAQYELDVACGYDMACDDILSFLSTLESEKSMNQEELEKEIETYFDSNFGIPWDGCHPIGVFELDSMARHFAKWGAEHLSNPNKAMEIDIEKECEPYTEMLYVPELSPELNSALKRLSRSYLYNFGCHIRNLILGIPEDNQKVEEMVDDIYKSIFEKQ